MTHPTTTTATGTTGMGAGGMNTHMHTTHAQTTHTGGVGMEAQKAKVQVRTCRRLSVAGLSWRQHLTVVCDVDNRLHRTFRVPQSTRYVDCSSRGCPNDVLLVLRGLMSTVPTSAGDSPCAHHRSYAHNRGHTHNWGHHGKHQVQNPW